MRRSAEEQIGSGSRQTRPDYYDGAAAPGALSVIPRRAWDARTAEYLQAAQSGAFGLRTWAESAPLRLLRLLVEIHPLAQQALSNDLTLAFMPGKTRIVAVKDYRVGKGTIDDAETQAISRLWAPYKRQADDLAADVGGLMALQHALGMRLNDTGEFCLEAVIGANPRGEGVVDVLDFDPLTCRWRDTEQGRIFEQRQADAPDGWRRLNLATVLSVPWLGLRDNPHGLARYRAFLAEGLADIAEQRSLRDWLYSIAYPHLMFTYPFQEMAAWAEEHPDELVGAGTDKDGNPQDLTPGQWATKHMKAFLEFAKTLKSDDVFMAPAGGDGKVLSAPNGPADELEQRRLRVIQSLDSLPFLHGITDGGTQAYGLATLTTHAAKLESLRETPNQALAAVAQLDLRTRGVDMIARVESEPIQLTDILAYWQAQEKRNQTIFQRVDRGYLSDEDAALMLSGSGVVDPARAQAAHEKAVGTGSTGDNNGANLPGGENGNQNA